MVPGDNQRDFYMGSLCGFKVLQHLHSDWNCLLPTLGSYTLGHEKENLSLVLPKSLKVLHVSDNDYLHERVHKSLIYQAIRAKTGPDALLPLLEALKFSMTPKKASAAGESLRDGADHHYQALKRGCEEGELSVLFENQRMPRFEL